MTETHNTDPAELIGQLAGHGFREFTAKERPVPSGKGVMWRVSWVANEMVGGHNGGWSRDNEQVGWYAWTNDGEYLGRSTTRRDALELLDEWVQHEGPRP